MLCFGGSYFFTAFSPVWFTKAQSRAVWRKMLVLCFLLVGWQLCGGGQSVWASRYCLRCHGLMACDKCWLILPPHLLSFTPSLTAQLGEFVGFISVSCVVKSVPSLCYFSMAPAEKACVLHVVVPSHFMRTNMLL